MLPRHLRERKRYRVVHVVRAGQLSGQRGEYGLQDLHGRPLLRRGEFRADGLPGRHLERPRRAGQQQPMRGMCAVVHSNQCDGAAHPSPTACAPSLHTAACCICCTLLQSTASRQDASVRCLLHSYSATGPVGSYCPEASTGPTPCPVPARRLEPARRVAPAVIATWRPCGSTRRECGWLNIRAATSPPRPTLTQTLTRPLPNPHLAITEP